MQNELIVRIRNELNLSKADVTDEDLLEGAKDTLMLNRIELGMSLSRLFKELKAAIGLIGQQ